MNYKRCQLRGAYLDRDEICNCKNETNKEDNEFGGIDLLIRNFQELCVPFAMTEKRTLPLRLRKQSQTLLLNGKRRRTLQR